MTANNSKSYLAYLNKLIDQYNNTYHHYINKKKPINADYSALIEKIETNPKASKFKVYWARITKYKNIFSKGYNENCLREMFITDSGLKTNPWTYEIKNLNGERIIRSSVAE